MGRFTAYDQNGRMVADFDKSDYDFLCRYGRTPEEVLDENAKLRELVKAMTPFLCCMPFASCNTLAASVRKRMSELGIEVTA